MTFETCALRNMVAIAQLAEHRIVVPSVVGSSPTSHPKRRLRSSFLCLVAWREPNKWAPEKLTFRGE